MVEFGEETNSKSITLYIPESIKSYIASQRANRSEWIREAGEEFLKLIENRIMNYLPNLEGRKIVSISKPNRRDLKKIFRLVKKHNLFFSRSEFFRMSIFLKMIMEILQKEAEIEEMLDYPDEPNTVRVPISIDDNGDKVFKIYKILSKLDY